MNWRKLTEEQEINEIKELSFSNPVMIYKHSTRCSMSSTAFNRLERSWDEGKTENIFPYYLDLLAFRNVSNKIAEIFKVKHESPQLLLIKNGQCVYHASHLHITYEEFISKL